MQILIIEDERKLAEAIPGGLRGNGYHMLVTHVGEAGLRHVGDHLIDLILLDVILPLIGERRYCEKFTAEC